MNPTPPTDDPDFRLVVGEMAAALADIAELVGLPRDTDVPGRIANEVRDTLSRRRRPRLRDTSLDTLASERAAVLAWLGNGQFARWRSTVGVTQAAAAAVLGVDVSSLSGWERGVHEPRDVNIDGLYRLADLWRRAIGQPPG